ncbi:MAG: tRNA (adenine57-N1/adenine58-N1)-methyltransferase catalytic subunit [Actinomycetota bacterium]|jgi:tRNA (adenine57-N1/adenine58-N1)-methyltransferase|nr:tRNA (adenine57-N1/adenine58-N1)-methyltransferase catalytic subunit [Actinomycetota bacterium]
MRSGGPFAVGDKVLVVDNKNRRYLVTLREGGQFHTHAGFIPHEQFVGQPEGSTLRSSSGSKYLTLRPTLSDFVLSMPRGAQVVYPKDLGPLLILADVYQGARILEAGVGSGALSMAMLQAGASVTGYEIRADFATVALKNVHSFLGPDVDYRIEERDVYDGIDESGLDRVVLDLPEPWRVVKHAEVALHPGGIFVSYLPTIGQVAQLHEALDASAFGLAQTIEVLQRSWHVAGQSVRPDHRMVAHTGFLTSARLLVPDSRSLAPIADPLPVDETDPVADDDPPVPDS